MAGAVDTGKRAKPEGKSDDDMVLLTNDALQSFLSPSILG